LLFAEFYAKQKKEHRVVFAFPFKILMILSCFGLEDWFVMLWVGSRILMVKKCCNADWLFIGCRDELTTAKQQH
jgi:hypothetical protein